MYTGKQTNKEKIKMKKSNLPLNESQIVKILKKIDCIDIVYKDNNLYIIANYFALKIDDVALQNYQKLQMYIRSIFGNIQEGEAFTYKKESGTQTRDCNCIDIFPENYMQYTFEYQWTKLYYYVHDALWTSNKACIFKTQSTDSENKYTFIAEDLIEFCNILADDTLNIRGYNDRKHPVYIQSQNSEFILILMPMNIKDNIEFLNYV